MLTQYYLTDNENVAGEKKIVISIHDGWDDEVYLANHIVDILDEKELPALKFIRAVKHLDIILTFYGSTA